MWRRGMFFRAVPLGTLSKGNLPSAGKITLHEQVDQLLGYPSTDRSTDSRDSLPAKRSGY